MKRDRCFLCDTEVFYNEAHNHWYHNDNGRIYLWCSVATPSNKKKKKKKKKKKHG